MRFSRTVSDCSLRLRGPRLQAAAFLSRSQTKGVSARSFVQASGARSWALGADAVVTLREPRAGSLIVPPIVSGARSENSSVISDPIPAYELISSRPGLTRCTA